MTVQAFENQYSPDYAVAPGFILEEHLEAQGLSRADFARRLGRSDKMVSEIIAGKAPVRPETAVQFERVLGVSAHIWLGIEADWSLYQTRLKDAQEAKDNAEWVAAFPVKELVKRGCFPAPKGPAETLSALLSFFAVGSVKAWCGRYENPAVAWRHSQAFESHHSALATWLRLGERVAEQQDCVEYKATQFKKSLRQIRNLTRCDIGQALEDAKRLCNQCGVALVLVPPLPKTALSGAAYWLPSGRPVIQLSGRHKSDDHLWFSFFHEAAHILLHSKKSVFVDADQKAADDIEEEANRWAKNALIPEKAWSDFVNGSCRSEQAVRSFADQQGIAPGLVVGMLQHEGRLPWTHLNKLKVRYRWT